MDQQGFNPSEDVEMQAANFMDEKTDPSWDESKSP